MAVLPMKHLLLCGLKKDRKPILELLQRLGVCEVEEGKEDTTFQKTDVSADSARFRTQAQTAENALLVLDREAPEKKGFSLNGRKEISVEEYERRVQTQNEAMALAQKILRLDKKKAELSAALPKRALVIESLLPWEGFDLPLNLRGTKTTDLFVGTLPGAWDLSSLYTEISREKPHLSAFDAEIISASDEQTCLSVFVRKEEAGELQEALQGLGFAKAPLSAENPAREAALLKNKNKEDENEIARIEEEIASYKDKREDLQFAADYYTMRADKYDVLSKLSQSKRTFLITGYLPAENEAALSEQLSGFDVFTEFTDPKEGEEVPVKLKNNPFAAPVESIVESYSMPAKGELDPAAIMAPFYYICFGLMLSDAAYGLIMVFGCLFALKKFKHMEEGLKKALTMFLYCGISTTFWGFMFGSFFGDAVNVIATTFFNRPDIALGPIWFEPVDMPMKMLVFSFVVGIIHLFTGLGILIYEDVKAGKIKDAIYDGVFWYLLVGGCIVYLLTMDMIVQMLGLSFILPSAVGKVAAVLAGIGAVGIILTSGRESKNWFKRILKGLYGFYGITSYLSDILSYSRLLALGLATGVISSVFNKMGSMLGNSVIGVILFIVVFVIGHAMNIAINALGAYVHTNRLQYVEFFGKFYEGGGRKLAPFGENTKYFKIKEAGK